MAAEQWLVVNKVVEVFESLGVPYYIGGSVASSKYGTPRSTRDVDFIAVLRGHQVDAFVSALEAEFYVDSLAVRRAVSAQRSFNLIHFETVWKIDIFVSSDAPWAISKMERRLNRALDDSADTPIVFLSSPEDLVLQKLLWYQKGGNVSEQQWQDVQGVLRVQNQSLDRAYMQHWAQELGLTDLLARSLDEAARTLAVPEKD
ncbi:MAG: hypothetical protein HOP19_02630 [Acidobacteria bacterium]|nr:hypothetical protein [Acidobacteriota bacterium]